MSLPVNRHPSQVRGMCKPCTAGTFSQSGATTCSACAAGRTDDDADAKTTCSSCGAGTFTRAGAYGECKRCHAEFYDHDGNATTDCQHCEIGGFANPAARPVPSLFPPPVACGVGPPGASRSVQRALSYAALLLCLAHF